MAANMDGCRGWWGSFKGSTEEFKSTISKLLEFTAGTLKHDSDLLAASLVSKTMPAWFDFDASDVGGWLDFPVVTLWGEWQRGENAYFITNRVKPPVSMTHKIYIYECGIAAILLVAYAIITELWLLYVGVGYSFLWMISLVYGTILGQLWFVVLGLFLWSWYYFLNTLFYEKIPNNVFNTIEILRGEASQSAKPNPISDAVQYFFYLIFKDDWHTYYRKYDLCLAKVQYNWTCLRQKGLHKKWLVLFIGFLWSLITLDMFRKLVRFSHWLVWTFWTLVVCAIQVNWTPLNTFCVALQIVRIYVWLHWLAYKVAQYCMALMGLLTLRRPRSVGAAEDNVVWVDMTGFQYIRIKAKMIRLNIVTEMLYFLKWIGFLVVVYSAQSDSFKLRAVLTQGAMDVTQYINELDPPQFIRSFRFFKDKQAIDDTLDLLRELGYPVESDITTQEPVWFDKSVLYKDWVTTGTNFVTGLAPLRIFKGLEFNKVRELAVPYKWSDEYVDIQNELESTSRYFQDVNVSLPNFEAAVDATWDSVKTIFAGSRITPFYMIYKNWKKNYNVGPFATSVRRPRNKLGYHVKMKRREDVGRFKNTKEYLAYWKRLYQNFPRMASFANVFYKSEALPPKKWTIGRIRTVVASYLPQYLWQMTFSYQSNHNLKPTQTPIKVGLPLTGFWLTQLFERHLSFKHHYAGDMTNFDSSISGEIMKAIKAIRTRGFENHRKVEMIKNMIDLNYDTIQNILLLTPSTGNIYKKGSGLTTGHASTSMDNSLTTVFLYMTAWVTLTGRNAADFKYFNELSCYGDDHILSIHEMAPRNWTFHNIQKLMATWGVQMRDEVEFITKVDLKTGEKVKVRARKSTELYPLPFLSKYCRKPTAEDVEDWHEAFGNRLLPKVLVYHDPVGLLGKAAAGSKQRNVEYRLTRLHSYIAMSAFNRPTYDALKVMAETIIRRYPKVPGKLKKIPTFAEVNRKFMDPNTKLKDVDSENPDDASLDELAGEAIQYGQMGVMDYIHNYLAVVPDVLNPSIQRIGYSVVTHRLVQPCLEWPKELVRVSNQVVTQGHFDKLMHQTPYKFLVDHSMPTVKCNEATLLVRHWIYMLFRSNDSDLNIFGMFDKFLIKVANLQFIMNGKVSSKVQQFSFPIRNTVLIILLSALQVPDVHIEYAEDSWFSVGNALLSLKLPDFSHYINRLSSLVSARIWHSIPPNFRELNYLIRGVPQGSWHYIMAGTGTGKSTNFIQFLDLYGPKTWEKIIVVEPRSKVVKGLVGYMKGLGLNCSGATTGLTLDPRARVWYVTAQECFLHLDWLNEGNLIVIDEAHLDEEVYSVLFKYLKKKTQCTTFLLSATPRDDQKVLVDSFTEVAIPKVYDTTEVDYPGHTLHVSSDYRSSKYWLLVYLNQVQNIMMMNKGYGKYLIFVNDKKDIDFMLTHLKGRGAGLSSSLDLPTDEDHDFIVTTAVADVAITVPGITHVITPNFKRSIEPTGATTVAPAFIPLDGSTIRQRKGRTGRTNNGWFYLLKFEFDEKGVVQEPSEKSNPMLVANWVLQGLPLEVLATTTPEVFDFRGPKRDHTATAKLVAEMEQAIKDQSLVVEVLDKDLSTEDPSHVPIRVMLRGDKTGVKKLMPIRSLRSHNMEDPPSLYGYKLDFSNQLNALTLYVANQFKMFGQGTNTAMWVNPQNLKPV
ncbi:RNA-dependent RNA polymerase [Neurospora discreta fusarivirus 2]|uniref:RNA-dependent RNA polymerase n=1 Tax=Neurospora discreta fusarivirus 2 TaxID=2776808 RepID=A0AAD1NGL4_9VIRU|nr:RNA-dependent RNA polymerase [Neurospora discreta fusarivirus 2]BCL64194.1 RNA-dependent RNA polymerase [Neurospora discreta fusarivirus 2]